MYPSTTLAPQSDITLRLASSDDSDFLCSAYVASRDEEMAQLAWDTPTKITFLRTQFSAQQQHYSANYDNATRYVILQNTQSIGVMWVARWPKEIRLMDMIILPEFRNHGIGTQLLQQLLDEASQSNKPIVLHTWEGNPAAARFYERQHFRKVSTDGMYARMEWHA